MVQHFYLAYVIGRFLHDKLLKPFFSQNIPRGTPYFECKKEAIYLLFVLLQLLMPCFKHGSIILVYFFCYLPVLSYTHVNWIEGETFSQNMLQTSVGLLAVDLSKYLTNETNEKKVDETNL